MLSQWISLEHLSPFLPSFPLPLQSKTESHYLDNIEKKEDGKKNHLNGETFDILITANCDKAEEKWRCHSLNVGDKV